MTVPEWEIRDVDLGVSSSSQIWPPVVDPSTLEQQVRSEVDAASIPALGKALHMHQLVGVMPLDCYRGVKPLAHRPRLLEQPDLSRPGSTWFVQMHVRDWLLSGNALHLVTARDAEGWPAAVRWFPARSWSIVKGTSDYLLNGKPVAVEDVVHVRRGEGIGIVEQYLRTLDRAALEEEAERQNLKRGGAPSVAVIAPPKVEMSGTQADEAADRWDQKFRGPGRRPVVLANGSQVIPLGWSASDQQMIEARQMSLVDISNLTGMDGYWLGSVGGSHNYRSPGLKWLELLRTTLEPMLSLFEDAWSEKWLPRGRTVQFNRLELTRDDLETSIRTVAAARKAGLMTYEEGRIYLGWDPDVPEPAATQAPAPDPAPDNPTDEPTDPEQDTTKEQAA